MSELENKKTSKLPPADSLCSTVNAAAGAPGRNPAQMSALVLAYIGDTVYDLFVRTGLVLSSDATAHGMHMMAAKRVCAAAQAKAAARLMPLLDEEEAAVYRRGRNAHMGTVPKHAAIGDYRAATGLEAVFGYLYLCGRDARLVELARLCLAESETKNETGNEQEGEI